MTAKGDPLLSTEKYSTANDRISRLGPVVQSTIKLNQNKREF